MNKKSNFPRKDYVLGIIRCKKKYLLLRFGMNCKYCPGDWDFITGYIGNKNDQKKTVIKKALKFETGLNGNVEKRYAPHYWSDPECEILWHYYAFLIKISTFNFSLNPESRYDKYKWLNKNKLLNHDRLGYLKGILNNTLFKEQGC